MLCTLPFVISLSFASKMEEDLEEFFIPLTFHREENICLRIFKKKDFGGEKKSPQNSSFLII